MKARLQSFLILLAKWNALKFAFFLGAVFGMTAMAILLTSARALAALTGALHG